MTNWYGRAHASYIRSYTIAENLFQKLVDFFYLKGHIVRLTISDVEFHPGNDQKFQKRITAGHESVTQFLENVTRGPENATLFPKIYDMHSGKKVLGT